MQRKGECIYKHDNLKNSRSCKRIMLCQNCEDYVEVTPEHKCNCCKLHVKRIDTKNKQIKLLTDAYIDLKPIIDFYEKNKPEHCQVMVPLAMGATIRNVPLEALTAFIKAPARQRCLRDRRRRDP